MNKTRLHKNFNTGNFQIGASKLKQILWYLVSIIFFKSGLVPFSSVLVAFLRIFGAIIGKDVRIKPGIHVKYPWKLRVGDSAWLADCYIENLAEVEVGANVCISQGAMLITGNHNYRKSSFDLITSPIILQEGVWLGAGSKVAPGVTVQSHAVLTMGSVATSNLDSYSIYRGNPAEKEKIREIS